VLSLATIFPEAGIDLSQITGQKAMPPGPNDKPKPEFTPVEPGSYSSAAIIMLTDGQRTTGPDPLEAAKMAAERGVRVYTVGIGTKDGETIGFEGWSMRVRLDEDALKAVATMTRADYFYAGTAEDLKKVYQGLSTKLVVEKKETEISALFAVLGALLVAAAAALSVAWFGRVA
jgi:Ca-activated chloride channel family protein